MISLFMSKKSFDLSRFTDRVGPASLDGSATTLYNASSTDPGLIQQTGVYFHDRVKTIYNDILKMSDKRHLLESNVTIIFLSK